jgi:hypothetical protein
MRQDTEYDTDFYEWTQSQAAKLRDAGSRRVNADVDWENVAEEVESLGRSDFRGLKSHTARIIDHLLELEFSTAREPRRAWEQSVANHRHEAELIMRDSPSLRRRLADAVEECYADGRSLAARGFRANGEDIADLPSLFSYTLPQILDDWFPANRHGLE